jgi:hypothetical protein
MKKRIFAVVTLIIGVIIFFFMPLPWESTGSGGPVINYDENEIGKPYSGSGGNEDFYTKGYEYRVITECKCEKGETAVDVYYEVDGKKVNVASHKTNEDIVYKDIVKPPRGNHSFGDLMVDYSYYYHWNQDSQLLSSCSRYKHPCRHGDGGCPCRPLLPV